jgi:hypothetical protein
VPRTRCVFDVLHVRSRRRKKHKIGGAGNAARPVLSCIAVSSRGKGERTWRTILGQDDETAGKGVCGCTYSVFMKPMTSSATMPLKGACFSGKSSRVSMAGVPEGEKTTTARGAARMATRGRLVALLLPRAGASCIPFVGKSVGEGAKAAMVLVSTRKRKYARWCKVNQDEERARVEDSNLVLPV